MDVTFRNKWVQCELVQRLDGYIRTKGRRWRRIIGINEKGDVESGRWTRS